MLPKLRNTTQDVQMYITKYTFCGTSYFINTILHTTYYNMQFSNKNPNPFQALPFTHHQLAVLNPFKEINPFMLGVIMKTDKFVGHKF